MIHDLEELLKLPAEVGKLESELAALYRQWRKLSDENRQRKEEMEAVRHTAFIAGAECGTQLIDPMGIPAWSRICQFLDDNTAKRFLIERCFDEWRKQIV